MEEILEKQKQESVKISNGCAIVRKYWARKEAGRFWFFETSLCSPGCPGTHSVDQASFEFGDPPASVSQVLRLKVCATPAGLA